MCFECTGHPAHILVMIPVVLARMQVPAGAETYMVRNPTVEELRIGLVAAKSTELVEEVGTAMAAVFGPEHVVEAG